MSNKPVTVSLPKPQLPDTKTKNQPTNKSKEGILPVYSIHGYQPDKNVLNRSLQ